MIRYYLCILITCITSITCLAQELEVASVYNPVQENDTLTQVKNMLAQENDTIRTDSLQDFQDKYDNNRFKRGRQFLHNDTVWKDYAMGTRVHLQRLTDTDTLVTIRKNDIKPILESLAINFGVWGYDHFFKDADWADVNAHTIHHNLRCKWILDHDSYSGNQFSHPYHGSMFYNAARYHGHDYYTSALYPLIGSCVWEYFCETNEPSYNDFLSTGIGGSAIGEMTHRVSDLVFDNSKTGVRRIFREIVGSFINPSRGFHRLFSGEMWRVSPSRGKRVSPEPFSLDVGIGNRYMREMRRQKRQKNVAYIDFAMNYGEHFDGKDHHQPFDFFRLYAQLNLSNEDPTFSDIDIRGRIATKQFQSHNDWKFDLGLYQVFKYVDNYGENGKSKSRMNAGDFAFINEACSFAGGLYMEKVHRGVSFSNDFMLDAIAFGGNTADYFSKRTYNYASGFSLRNEIRFCVNNRMVIGDDFYFVRMYMFKGNEPMKPDTPVEYSKWAWGDKGNCSIYQNRAYLQFFLKHNLKLNAEHKLFYRRSNYASFDNVHAKSFELRFGIIYAI